MNRSARLRSPHPAALVLGAVVSVQFGAALATTMIRQIGAPPTVAIRLVAAALILLVVVRPSVRGRARRDWLAVGALGIALAAMNLSFYGAIKFLPLGVVVTIELLGPLALATLASRRPRDVIAVLVALAGVVATSGVLDTPLAELNLAGVALSLAAGVAWACYILAARGVGHRWAQVDGLAVGMAIATVFVVPYAAATTPDLQLTLALLATGTVVGLLSSVIPYSLELTALRRIDNRVFGVLVSVEPAVAAIAAYLVIGEALTSLELVGMVLVIIASALVMIDQRTSPTEEVGEIA